MTLVEQIIDIIIQWGCTHGEYNELCSTQCKCPCHSIDYDGDPEKFPAWYANKLVDSGIFDDSDERVERGSR